MTEIKVSKQDLIWGYFAQFFSIASGIIILPMVLRMLSPADIGMNYLMLSVGQLVTLVDFGFSPQFSRNVTYVYSGAQRLLRTGVERLDNSVSVEMNYSLLSSLIQTARWIYSLMAIMVLFLLLTVGTAYIHKVTNGFSNVTYSWQIWLIYSAEISFQIYYSYYSALLIGSGKIKESRKVMVYSYLLKIVLTYVLLYKGYALLGVVIANFIYPFLTRYLSYRYYFTVDLKQLISPYKVAISEKKALFKILWYNSKKMGLSILSSYLAKGSSTLLAGLYLSLDDVASYGLMTQLVSLVSIVSLVMFNLYLPRLTSLCISNDRELFRKEVAYTIVVFYILFFVGMILVIFVAPFILSFISSKTILPSIFLIIIYGCVELFNYNFWILCHAVIAENDFPFLKSTLFTGVGVVIGCYVSLSWLHLGLWGIVLSTGLAQSAYNNWYWPHVILKQMNSKKFCFVKEGFCEILVRLHR